jgi:uncharacterized protein (TIGR03437 family)
MMRLAALILAANMLFAGDFLNGQAARAVIGQPFFTAQLPGPASATYPGNMLLGSVSGLAYANGMLIVADSSPFRVGADPQNNRVLIYNSIFGLADPNSATGPTHLPPATGEPVVNKNSPSWWCPVCGGRADVVLGQTDFNGTGFATGASGLRTPTAVATDGIHLAVADTDNNRVLLWNAIPATNGQAADHVLGQPDMATVTPNTGTTNVLFPAANTLRAPQGVWIQGNQLFVVDSGNNRVLIWNSWPTTNRQPADLVLGQPDFTTQTQGDLTKGIPPASATNMLNPASVSSDGTRLFVADLGQSRVLIWNRIPTQNQAAADVALGQLDMTGSSPDNAYATNTTTGVQTPVMCKVSNGKDTAGNLTYPPMCEFTLSLPRYALSDGTRLFVADGGNDRVLIYSPIPTASGAAAIGVLGQTDFISDTSTDNANDTVNAARIASADSIRTPCGLAWDGTNLFVSEAFSRRVLVFTAASSPTLIAPRNAASMEVFAGGLITVTGTPVAGDKVTATITNNTTTRTASYSYTVVSTDNVGKIATQVAAAINATPGDPDVLATAEPGVADVRVMARVAGPAGNNIALTTATTAATGGTQLNASSIKGGSDASHVAPGTLVAIFGQNLTANDTVAVSFDGTNPLPTRVGTAPKSVEAFANGIAMPLLYVSPSQINAQIPFEIAPASSISVFVRSTDASGVVTVANAVALPVNEGVPGYFAFSQDAGGNILTDPRPAIAVHNSSYPQGVIDLELTAVTPVVGDAVSITIGSNTYTYAVPATTTTLDNVRDALVAMITANDPNVSAVAGGQWDRVILIADKPGSAGNGLAYSGANTGTGTVTAAAYTSALCCANTTRGALVINDGIVTGVAASPAQPGEIITLYATGLGLIQPTPTGGFVTGSPYTGVFPNKVADYLNEFVAGTFGGLSVQVLNAAMLPKTIGIYQIDVLLSTGTPNNPASEGTIAQQLFVTNIVTVPVQAP